MSDFFWNTYVRIFLMFLNMVTSTSVVFDSLFARAGVKEQKALQGLPERNSGALIRFLTIR